MPNEDETFDVTVSDTQHLSPKCWIWNASVGYLEVVKYSLYNSTITVRNLGRRENAKLGTEFPTCMEFLITAPTALDPYNPLSTCLAADFNSPTVGQEAYMSVGSTYVLKVEDQIIVDGDYRYEVTQVVNPTTLKVRNEGLGKDGIIEVGCNSCVPVQVVSNLNCCPIPTGDLTSNTSVLTIDTGYDVLLDNATLTLDTDLSKYDNSTSEFITLTDVPHGTLDSNSSLLGITGGVGNVLGDITLSLNTDLSQYDNATSGFITAGDIPRGELSSSTNILTVSNGVNNVLGNIELSVDTDLSKYNNTNSSFVSTFDKKNLTSTTSVLSVTSGTGATLEDASLSLDTDLSKYDNTTSSFVSASDKKNLISTSSIITVTNGTGSTLEDVSLTINTDLSQYDNNTSGFITEVSSLNDIGDVTISTPSANEILKYDGSKWINSSYSTGAINWGDIGGTLSNQTDLDTALSGKQPQLNGTGLVKANGTTITYDNTTYQASLNGTGFVKASGTTISYDDTDYIPLAGSASISGDLRPVKGNSYAVGGANAYWKQGCFTNIYGTTAYIQKIHASSALLVGGTGLFQLYANSNTSKSLYFDSDAFYPASGATLGAASYRWGRTYLNRGAPLDLNGTIIVHESTGNERSVIKRTSTSGGIFILDSDEVGVRLAHGSTSWATVSDRRQKRDIVSLEDSLETINALNPIRFNYNEEKEDAPTRVGFVAQEIREVIPEAVTGEETETEFLAVSTTEIIPFLVKSVQELSSKVDELNAKIKLLEGRV